MATQKKLSATIYRDGSMCFIPVPFDPEPIFGKIRAPVTVTVNGHSYRIALAVKQIAMRPAKRKKA